MATSHIVLIVLTLITLAIIGIVKLVRYSNRRRYSNWEKGDEILFEYLGVGGQWRAEAKKLNTKTGNNTGVLIKWNMKEALVEFENGNKYFIEQSYIEKNLSYQLRKRVDKLDDFMEDNVLNKQQQEREDKIGSVLD